ncbi:hypothetical protein [Pasteuria penetrans]|uniref:hypothetical protein n=1 Tax=Pasteuria penetrans TaxID=86005 RepID=UPI0011EBF3DC|nr:hypothetical protein [Pasteuria penetrans]
MMKMWILLSLVPVIGVVCYFVLRYLMRKVIASLGKYYPSRTAHLVLLTCNSQRRVEWTVWSYHLWNSLRCRKSRITCIDVGSTDDTLAILVRLRGRYREMEVIRMMSDEDSVDDSIRTWLQIQKPRPNEKRVVLDLRECDPQPEGTKNHGRNLA